jgi:hypothetical protein
VTYVDNSGNSGVYISGNDAVYSSPSGPLGMAQGNFGVQGSDFVANITQ